MELRFVVIFVVLFGSSGITQCQGLNSSNETHATVAIIGENISSEKSSPYRPPRSMTDRNEAKMPAEDEPSQEINEPTTFEGTENMKPQSASVEIASQLHDHLVSHGAATQQQVFLMPAQETTSTSAGQFVTQGNDDQFYKLMPIQQPDPVDQSRTIQAQAAQLRLQAQIQQTQAAQLRRLEDQLAALSKTPTADPQFFAVAPIPQEIPLKQGFPEHYLLDPRFFVQPALAQEQYTELLRQKEEPVQSPRSKSKPTKIHFEKSLLSPKAVSEPEPFEVFSDSSINKLIQDLANGYAPVEDTPQYTIYHVKEPESRLPASLKQSPSKPIPRPVKVVPAEGIGLNYRGIVETTQRKPQTVFKSAIDPECYNAVKTKLISTFSNDRFRPIAGLSPPPPPLPQFLAQFRGDRFEPQVPSRGYNGKPFRPSPVDLGPLDTEPLFESLGQNQPVGESTINSPSTLHPTKFSSKYVDIDYSPGIQLPANEAAFAAIQAQNLGGPGFIDPEYLESALGYELNGKILEPLPANEELFAQDLLGAGQNEAKPYYNMLSELYRQDYIPEFKSFLRQQAESDKAAVQLYNNRPELHRNEIKATVAKSGATKSSISNLELELKQLDVNRRPVVSAPLLAKILKEATGEDLQLENYY